METQNKMMKIRKIPQNCLNCGAKINKPVSLNRPTKPYPIVVCNMCGNILNPVVSCKPDEPMISQPQKAPGKHTDKYFDIDLAEIGIRCTKVIQRVRIIDGGNLLFGNWFRSEYRVK